MFFPTHREPPAYCLEQQALLDRRLLEIVCDDIREGESGYYAEVYHCMNATLLIMEGSAPEVVRKGLEGGPVHDMLS